MKQVQYFIGLAAIDDTQTIAVAHRILVRHYQGYTETFGNGCWQDANNNLIEEKQVTYTVVTDKPASVIEYVAVQLRNLFRQQCVLVVTTIPTHVEFV